MTKLFLCIMGVFLVLLTPIYADTNGVWIDAKDIKAGTFGSDESSGNFVFPNNLQVGNLLEGSEVRISGKLGVGVVNPQKVVHIAYASTSLHNNGQVLIENTNTVANSNTAIELRVNNPNSVSGLQFSQGDYATTSNRASLIYNFNRDFLGFYSPDATNSMTPRFVIEKDGNVGLGTDSPDKKFHLAYSSNSLHNNGQVLIENTNSAANSNSVMELRVSNSNSVSGFQFSNGDYATSSDRAAFIYNFISDHFGFYTHNSATGGMAPRLVVEKDGDVGIKKTNPTATLDVAGSIKGNSIYEGSQRVATRNYVDSRTGGSSTYNDLPAGALAGYCHTANWRHLPNHGSRGAVAPAILIDRGSGRYDCGCESGWASVHTGLGYRYNEWDVRYHSCRKL